MAYPLRIQRAENGWLLATDTKRNVVLRVDPATVQADQALYINGRPLAVGMLGKEIFVGVEHKSAIEIFCYNGIYLGDLAGPGEIGHPIDMAIDSTAGLVFALDGRAPDVKVYNASDRSSVGTIGAGQLHSPTGVAVDPSRQEVLVSDYGALGIAAPSVKIFSYATETLGNLVAEIIREGTCGFSGCRDGFSRPRGLAVHNSRVYVTDALLGQVLVFDRATLAYVSGAELGIGGIGERDLRMPSDVAINAAGDVFVTSSRSKSIVVFRGGAL